MKKFPFSANISVSEWQTYFVRSPYENEENVKNNDNSDEKIDVQRA